MTKYQVEVNNFKQRLILSGLVVAGFLSVMGANRAAAEVAGQFQFVQGNVSVVDSNGNLQAATKGLSFNSGDKIVTGKSSIAQLRMQDNGTIAVRQDSELTIAAFRYTKDVKTDAVAFRLLRGAFRSVTGLIGINNKVNYVVTTPTATIGVRGTDHEPTYIPSSGWSGAPGRTPGTYDRVYSGKTVLTSSGSGQQIEILPGQTGFVPKENAKPQLVYLTLILANSGSHVDGKQTSNGSDQEGSVIKNQANDQQAWFVNQAIPYADYLRVLASGNADPLTMYFKQYLTNILGGGGNPGDYIIDSVTPRNGGYEVKYTDKTQPQHANLSFTIPAPPSTAARMDPALVSPKDQKLGQILH